MTNRGLSACSNIYRSDTECYHAFSLAEDYPKVIDHFVRSDFLGKVILDLGCGTGKYVRKFAPISNHYFGLDQAQAMLAYAQGKLRNIKNHTLINADAASIPLPDQHVDMVFSSWGLGAVIEDEKREKILNEVFRVLKPTGKVILVENDIGGEFETLRDRFPNSKRTSDYHNWLRSKGFELSNRVESYFQFSSARQAQKCFSKIWGFEVGAKVNQRQIVHRIGIFVYVAGA